MLERRQFLRGLVAAPAIIKLAPLMRLSVFDLVVPPIRPIFTDCVYVQLDIVYGYIFARPEWVTAIGEVL